MAPGRLSGSDGGSTRRVYKPLEKPAAYVMAGERRENHPEAFSGSHEEYKEDRKDAEQCRTDVGRRLCRRRAQVVVAKMKMRTSRGTPAPGAEPDAVEEKPRRSSHPEIFLAFPEEIGRASC